MITGFGLTPGPHYALSELLIVAAALYCMKIWWGRDLNLAAIGACIMALIASVGAARFGFDLQVELRPFHVGASQIGGLFALLFIVAQLCVQVPVVHYNPGLKQVAVFALIILVFSGLAGILPPKTTLLLCLGVGVISAGLLPHTHIAHRFLACVWFLILGANFLFIRQSELLGPAMSWHGFHGVMALWLIGMLFILRSTRWNLTRC